MFAKGGRRTTRVASEHIVRLRDILAVLDRSRGPEDTRLPGFRLHPLTGDHRGYWGVSVYGDWRITFRFVEGDAAEVDYVDYH